MDGGGSILRKVAVAVMATFLALACGGSTAAPAASPTAGGTPEKATLRVGVGGQGQLIYMPLTLADQLGYFKDEGLTVDIQDLKGGAQALTALTGGSVDVVTGFYEHTIRTQAQGKFIEMIALFDLTPGLVLFVNKKHQDARSIKDIANLKIGITSAGSSTDEMVRYLFKQGGLDPNTAQTVAVGTGGPAVTALKNDQIQALVTVEPAASTLEQSGDGKAIYDTRTQAGTREVFGGAWPAGGFYLQGDFVKHNPKTAAALGRVAVRTLKFIKTHSPEEITAKLPQQIFYSDGNKDGFAKVLKANLNMYSQDGLMPPDGPDNVLKTLKVADTKADWSAIDLKRTFDNSFVKAAASAK